MMKRMKFAIAALLAGVTVQVQTAPKAGGSLYGAQVYAANLTSNTGAIQLKREGTTQLLAEIPEGGTEVLIAHLGPANPLEHLKKVNKNQILAFEISLPKGKKGMTCVLKRWNGKDYAGVAKEGVPVGQIPLLEIKRGFPLQLTNEGTKSPNLILRWTVGDVIVELLWGGKTLLKRDWFYFIIKGSLQKYYVAPSQPIARK